MISPRVGRWISEDGRTVVADPTNPYRYARNNPVTTRDGSDLMQEKQDEKLPTYDRMGNPVGDWRPQPENGFVITIAKQVRHVFKSVMGSTFDLGLPLQPLASPAPAVPIMVPPSPLLYQEVTITARAYRMYRFHGKFVSRDGKPIGASNDPLDFYSEVRVTVNFGIPTAAGGQLAGPHRIVFRSRPLKGREGNVDNVGVFIRQGPDDIEHVADRFKPPAEPRSQPLSVDHIYRFVTEFLNHVEKNVKPGPLKG